MARPSRPAPIICLALRRWECALLFVCGFGLQWPEDSREDREPWALGGESIYRIVFHGSVLVRCSC